MSYIPYIRFALIQSFSAFHLKRYCNFYTCFTFSSNFWQFQPVLVKQDQEKTENGKSGKRKARSRVNPNPDPVGTIEPSTSSTAS